MKYEINYVYADSSYLLTMEDGRAALVNLDAGSVEYEDNMEAFLTFGSFEPVTAAPPDEIREVIDAIIDETVLMESVDTNTMLQKMLEFGEAMDQK